MRSDQTVLILLFFLLSSALAQAWTLTGNYDPVQPSSSLPSRELDAALEKKASKGLSLHTKAREFVRSLDTAASCVRTAAFGLIRDCSGLESKPSEEHMALDSIKALYAARLAVCELREAGLTVPSQCSLDLIERNRGGFFTLKSDPKRAVSTCIKALEARPQSWTSYSNSRQNALLICQAARPEAEREEMIAMFKSLVDNNEASEEALREQLIFSKAQLAQQRALATELQAFSTTVKTEIEAGLESAVMAFDRIRSQAGAAEAEVVRMFADIMQQARGDMQMLFESLLQQKSALQDANTDIGGLVNSVSDQGRAILTQWRNEIETNSLFVAQAQANLAGITSQHDKLQQDLENMQENVASTRREQFQAQQDIRLGSQETIASFARLQVSAMKITTALEDVSAYAGLISSLAGSFDTMLKWSLVGLALAFLGTSVLFFGKRGLLVASITVCSTVLCVNHSKLLQWTTQKVPMMVHQHLSSCSTMSLLSLPLALAAVILLVTSAHRQFYSQSRRLRAQTHFNLEEDSLPIFQPGFSAVTSQSELSFQYYDPLAQDFKPTVPP